MTATWVRVWREGISPQLSTAALEALRAGLMTDDARICQGTTTEPPPLPACDDFPCERADPVAFALWVGDGLTTVREIHDRWAEVMAKCDALLEETTVCRWFLTAIDEMTREDMRRQLLAEVNASLASRMAGAAVEVA